jgi:ribonuclease-3 family protein
MGDAVFEILVRTMLVADGKKSPNDYHKLAKFFVRAGSQSDMYHKLEAVLTEEEISVMRRGRNAKSYTKAKNATVSDYRHATGLESLFGYVYLKGDTQRIIELFDICVKDFNDISI